MITETESPRENVPGSAEEELAILRSMLEMRAFEEDEIVTFGADDVDY